MLYNMLIILNFWWHYSQYDFYTDFKELIYINICENFAITISHLFSQQEQ